MPPTEVILKPRRALPFFSRHPWVFAGAIDAVRVDGEKVDPNTVDPGTNVRLVTASSEFVAHGLYNAHSNLRVRLYAWDEQETVDIELFTRRIDDAIACRRTLFGEPTPESACRMIYSESDGLSGLTVDRYGEWLLVQFTSRALHRFADDIVRLLVERLAPRGVYLRTERGIGVSEQLNITDGLVHGEEPPRPLFVQEHDIRYGVDVVEGQKTGFYLDQRDNRSAVAGHVSGHRVLDAFCYTGMYGITAVRSGGARSSLGIDSSEAALTSARANAELNEVSSQCRFEKADVKKRLVELAGAGETFDTVILDPPKMARNRSGIEKALKAYFHLNRSAIDLIPAGGFLVTCSCSGHIANDQFRQMLSSVSQNADRAIRIIESRGQAADHPVSVNCPETGYLKCLICRVS